MKLCYEVASFALCFLAVCTGCSSRCGVYTNKSDKVSAELWVHSVYINTSECGTACSNFTASVRLKSTSTYLCIIRFNLASSVSCTRPNGCNCTYHEKGLFMLSFYVNITTGAGTWAVKSESDSYEFLVADDGSSKSSKIYVGHETSEGSTVASFVRENKTLFNDFPNATETTKGSTSKNISREASHSVAERAEVVASASLAVSLAAVTVCLVMSCRKRCSRLQSSTLVLNANTSDPARPEEASVSVYQLPRNTADNTYEDVSGGFLQDASKTEYFTVSNASSAATAIVLSDSCLTECCSDVGGSQYAEPTCTFLPIDYLHPVAF